MADEITAHAYKLPTAGCGEGTLPLAEPPLFLQEDRMVKRNESDADEVQLSKLLQNPCNKQAAVVDRIDLVVPRGANKDGEIIKRHLLEDNATNHVIDPCAIPERAGNTGVGKANL